MIVNKFLVSLIRILAFPDIPDTEKLLEKIPYVIGELYLFSESNDILLDDYCKPFIPNDSVYYSGEKKIIQHNQPKLKESKPRNGQIIKTKKACKLINLTYPYFTTLIKRFNLEEKLEYGKRRGYIKFNMNALNLMKKD